MTIWLELYPEHQNGFEVLVWNGYFDYFTILYDYQEFSLQQSCFLFIISMALQTITNKQKSILRKLQQKKHRRLLGLCTVEGEKGVFEAFEAGVVEVVIIDSKYKGKIPKQVEVYVATPGELKDLQQTETFPGIMAVCAIPEVKSIGNGHVIILDRMSDPGNMGTIIRTADWFGIRDIVLSQECTDPYAPKVVRSTMGAIFR